MIDINDNLVKRLRLDGLPPEEQAEAVQSALTVVYQNIGDRVAEALDEARFDEFDELMKRDPESEELLKWLRQNLPDYPEIVDEELEKYVSRVNKLVDDAMAKY